MALLFGNKPIVIDALSLTPPTAQNAGINVQGVPAVMVTVSQINDLNSYELSAFGVADDLDSGGNTTYPAASQWPELDVYKRTRTGSTTFYMDLEGINRLDFGVLTWDPSGGAPSISVRVAPLSERPIAAIRTALQLQGLTDVELDRLFGLVQDDFTPRRLDTAFTILPQDGDHIDILVAFTDVTGVRQLLELTRLIVMIWDLSGNLIDPAVLVCEIIAPGAMNTVGANNQIIGISDSSGQLTIRITNLTHPSSVFAFPIMWVSLDLGPVVPTFIAFAP